MGNKKPPLQEVRLPDYKPSAGQRFRAGPQPVEFKITVIQLAPFEKPKIQDSGGSYMTITPFQTGNYSSLWMSLL